MSFSGFLIKAGTYEIPLSFMRYETYQIGYHGQDLDSYRDANGVLHRNALSHRIGKIEFNTPLMTMAEFQEVWSKVKAKYINATEKSISLTFYVPELDDYVTQTMYVPDIEFTIRNIDGNTVNIGETRIAFIAY